MADRRLVAAVPAGAADVSVPAVGAPATSSWRSLVDVCASSAGPFDASLLSAWRRELDDVEAQVAALRADASGAGPTDALPFGVHALLTLAGARLGSVWQRGQLIDAAAAIELARYAVLHHEAVRDREHDLSSMNRQHVLGGDWSITQAARLVADIGPSAYRVLVRGWGAAQLVQLRTGRAASRDALFDTAISLGALSAGVSTQTPLRLGDRPCVAAQLLDWATRL
jgi:hypothetical protein